MLHAEEGQVSTCRLCAAISIECVQDGYQLLFDDRSLRTPGRHPLRLPNAALALGVAAEWQWQVGERCQVLFCVFKTLKGYCVQTC